ncbi:hypothetical protein KKI24_11195 [bacterium]|nr:hypothetical protein [bacterium]
MQPSNQSRIGHVVGQSILPLLAFLNAADAVLSTYLLRIYGIEIDRNPVIAAVLSFDNTANVYIVLKLAGSALILIYWITAKKIRPLIHIVGTIVLAGYIIYFGRELSTIIQFLSSRN